MDVCVKFHDLAMMIWLSIHKFNPPWLKSKLTKFEAVSIKSVGGVQSYARCGNRQNGTNLYLPLKMADFLTLKHLRCLTARALITP